MLKNIALSVLNKFFDYIKKKTLKSIFVLAENKTRLNKNKFLTEIKKFS